jgi:stage III sporulation protein AA
MYREGRPKSTLIISPPGVGKTTLLRDLIRQVSDGCQYGQGVNVGVVDERSELAGCFLGVPQLDVGMRTDVMDACPKLAGMMMLLRSMSPKVLAIDELGDGEELRCLMSASACGVKVFATVHGEDFADVKRRFGIQQERWRAVFERCLVLTPEADQRGVRIMEGDMSGA